MAAVVQRRLGVDLNALLALLGTLLGGEYLAGALIAVMLVTGRALDAAAQRRATRDLRALLERAPRTARRRVGDVVSEVPVDEVAAGDLVLVGPVRCCRSTGWSTEARRCWTSRRSPANRNWSSGPGTRSAAAP